MVRRLDEAVDRVAQTGAEDSVEFRNRHLAGSGFAFHPVSEFDDVPRFAKQAEPWQLLQQKADVRLDGSCGEDLHRVTAAVERHVQQRLSAQPLKLLRQPFPDVGDVPPDNRPVKLNHLAIVDREVFVFGDRWQQAQQPDLGHAAVDVRRDDRVEQIKLRLQLNVVLDVRVVIAAGLADFLLPD